MKRVPSLCNHSLEFAEKETINFLVLSDGNDCRALQRPISKRSIELFLTKNELQQFTDKFLNDGLISIVLHFLNI